MTRSVNASRVVRCWNVRTNPERLGTTLNAVTLILWRVKVQVSDVSGKKYVRQFVCLKRILSDEILEHAHEPGPAGHDTEHRHTYPVVCQKIYNLVEYSVGQIFCQKSSLSDKDFVRLHPAAVSNQASTVETR